MYTQMNLTAETGNDAVSLWQVTTDILGPQPMSGFAPNAEFCFETPFGRVCIEINTAELDEAQLKNVSLGQILSDAFSRPRLKGACLRICKWRVCVIVCI